MRALQRANEVRHARAALKRQIAEGEISASEVILSPSSEIESIDVLELFAGSLAADDLVAFEVSGNAAEIARILESAGAQTGESPVQRAHRACTGYLRGSPSGPHDSLSPDLASDATPPHAGPLGAATRRPSRVPSANAGPRRSRSKAH
jgi:hypothetical protein